MNTDLLRRSDHSERGSDAATPPIDRAPIPRIGGLVWLLFCLLGGYLLFCHGCHGDEDNELLSLTRDARLLSSLPHSSGTRHFNEQGLRQELKLSLVVFQTRGQS